MSLYTCVKRIQDDAAEDEGKLDNLARHDAAGIGPSVLLLAVQIAKLRGDIARLVAEAKS
jgi:hypothetical protein